MSVSLKVALGAAKGAPRECNQEFWASRGPPWAVHPIQKDSPVRPSARPEVAPEGLGAIFELLKNRWFLCYFEPSERSSGVKGARKRRSANQNETLASFRWAVGDPGTPWKEPWRVPGWTLRVQGAIPGRQGVLWHCLTLLLWVPKVLWYSPN